MNKLHDLLEILIAPCSFWSTHFLWQQNRSG